MKYRRFLLILLLAVLLTGCAKGGNAPEQTAATTIPETTIPETVAETTAPTETIPETEVPTEPTVPVLTNVWDIMDNAGVEEIELLPGLEVTDIDKWYKTSPFQEIKLYQRTIFETLRLGTIGDVTVAQLVTNPDVYQTDYDYSADPVWNVRMEKSDGLKNNTGIEIPEDAWYSEFEINRPGGETATVVCYDWPIEGDPNDTSAPVRTVELFLAYFEDTGNLYSIYTNQTVFTWNGQSWDSNMVRDPCVVLYYIKADGPNYYKYITDYDREHNRGKVRYFRIKLPGQELTYQFEIGMTMEQWVNSKYNTDGWKFVSTDHGFYDVCSPDGRYKFNKDHWIWGVMRPD